MESEFARREVRPDPAKRHHTGTLRPVKELRPSGGREQFTHGLRTRQMGRQSRRTKGKGKRTGRGQRQRRKTIRPRVLTRSPAFPSGLDPGLVHLPSPSRIDPTHRHADGELAIECRGIDEPSPPFGRSAAASARIIAATEDSFNEQFMPPAPSTRLHADRAAGRHRHHRGPDRVAATRRPGRARGGAAGPVHEQPQADRPRPAQLPRVVEQLPGRVPLRLPGGCLPKSSPSQYRWSALAQMAPLPGAGQPLQRAQLQLPDRPQADGRAARSSGRTSRPTRR